MANKPDELAGTQRAAILLMSLGEQDAANLLKQLDARDVRLRHDRPFTSTSRFGPFLE